MAQEGREIIVTTCQTCPFVVNDNEFGHISCNLSEEVSTHLGFGKWKQLPEDKVHDLCPLKQGNYTVKL